MKYTCNTAIERFPKAVLLLNAARFSSIRRLMRQLVNSLLRAPLAVQPQWSTRVIVPAKLELPTHIAQRGLPAMS